MHNTQASERSPNHSPPPSFSSPHTHVQQQHRSLVSLSLAVSGFAGCFWDQCKTVHSNPPHMQSFCVLKAIQRNTRLFVRLFCPPCLSLCSVICFSCPVYLICPTCLVYPICLSYNIFPILSVCFVLFVYFSVCLFIILHVCFVCIFSLVMYARSVWPVCLYVMFICLFFCVCLPCSAFLSYLSFPVYSVILVCLSPYKW